MSLGVDPTTSEELGDGVMDIISEATERIYTVHEIEDSDYVLEIEWADEAGGVVRKFAARPWIE